MVCCASSNLVVLPVFRRLFSQRPHWIGCVHVLLLLLQTLEQSNLCGNKQRTKKRLSTMKQKRLELFHKNFTTFMKSYTLQTKHALQRSKTVLKVNITSHHIFSMHSIQPSWVLTLFTVNKHTENEKEPNSHPKLFVYSIVVSRMPHNKTNFTLEMLYNFPILASTINNIFTIYTVLLGTYKSALTMTVHFNLVVNKCTVY